jgi:hypothetical protein
MQAPRAFDFFFLLSRVEWLQQHGWAPRLLLFAPVDDSDENRLIVATRPAPPRAAPS